jgi:hypothetical protein
MCNVRHSTIFLFKKVSEHKVTQNSVRGVVLVIPMPKRKILKRHSALHPSEKELLEQRSSMFHHKNNPV